MEESRVGDMVVTLPAHVDLGNTDTIKGEIKSALDGESVHRLILDLRLMSFLDSLGVGLLVYARNRCLGVEVELLLRNSSPMATRLLSLSALDTLFTFEAGSTSAGGQSA